MRSYLDGGTRRRRSDYGGGLGEVHGVGFVGEALTKSVAPRLGWWRSLRGSSRRWRSLPRGGGWRLRRVAPWFPKGQRLGGGSRIEGAARPTSSAQLSRSRHRTRRNMRNEARSSMSGRISGRRRKMA
ncbi:hypothetical protein M6B38_369080 [Iris pallida]|uniref:Uncharacterized protein n=1 Tax=Iris pallida TaxID=29817 RepID=A0AAX6GG40_IRIPA|nr:hypothetical protein M6B38_369080 [Iris pallida]